MIKKISNWGNYPEMESDVKTVRNEGEAVQLLSNQEIIPRGAGRCYGDASLSSHVMSTLSLNHFLEFDEKSGILYCEAGVTLDQILETFVPRGWFLPVTPGTKFITVGGALSSDVHGKNHHKEGSFSDYVLDFELLMSDGDVVSCSKTRNPELFYATSGGMGLTGVILRVRFQLKKISTSYIAQKQVKARNLEEIIDLFEQHKHYTYSMEWIDCLKQGKGFGRSIMMAGEHATIEQLSPSQAKDPLKVHNATKFTMPFNLPGFVLNKWSVKAFNFLYYGKNFSREQESVVNYDSFFYPLDGILHWNRMYGRSGFVQYQFVLPLSTSKEGLIEVLNRINKKGWGSFLAVLKLFGPQNGMIAFPMEGYTLALDFPVRRGLFPFLDELDEVVADLGGRVYLTKDARMRSNYFKKMYPNSERFIQLVAKYNPSFKFQSVQSNRLKITP